MPINVCSILRKNGMPFAPGHLLLADIGATNARFGLLSEGILGPIKHLKVADFSRFLDAVDYFIFRHCPERVIKTALLAVAGPVEGERCALTNCSWTIDASDLRAAFGFIDVSLLNDFEASARSLPHLTQAHVYKLGGGRGIGSAPMAVVGPGSGLGVACLVPGSKHPVVIASEGGHMTMAASSSREDAVIDHLRRQFGHVSAERLVSGAGLENVYQAITAIDRIDAPLRSAAEITKTALDGTCQTARAALDMFCAMLGSIAGDVALTFGAQGGVYIAGGIAPRIIKHLDQSEFRRRFESKGRLRPYLAAISSSVIMHPAATFVGLSSLATRTEVN
jgi:glucokinase